MFSTRSNLPQADPELWAAIQQENQRQEDHIELIASENYASPNVLAAQGSQLTNKYAEGLPGKRYYGGCEFVDIAEQLAIDRAKKLFGADAANVQPQLGLAGEPGGVLRRDEARRHLPRHVARDGRPPDARLAGQHERQVVQRAQLRAERPRRRSTTTALERLAREHRPKLILAGASAYSLRIDFERIGRDREEVGAYFMVDMAHYAGLIAAGEYPNPGRRRRFRHQHHAQDAARPARRLRPRARRAREADQLRRCSPACRAAR